VKPGLCKYYIGPALNLLSTEYLLPSSFYLKLDSNQVDIDSNCYYRIFSKMIDR